MSLNCRSRAQLMVDEKYANVKEEVSDKTRKLKRLMRKYKELQEEQKELQNQWENEKEGCAWRHC